MKILKTIFALLLMLSVFISCTEHKKKKKVKVKVYKTAVHKASTVSGIGASGSAVESNLATEDDFLYWYFIYGQNDTYYSYSSSAPVTNYSTISWSRSSGMPSSFNAKEAQEQPEQEVGLDEMDPDMVDDMADDGVTPIEEPEAEENETESETESDSESDSGSDSDGSSSDSGSDSGGDGGGGDGGGGE